ncbi:Prenylcysteine oxidase (Chloride ion pump-associated 55 kDa protein) [Durusdinium trenchii]|uniref:Prenylcysteine oxidase (Chloride ion pump-associated 55 kDa protein) n=1 Tax=Durusdinium trenchii TaxID=1381693 RepID=A0ABP0LID8_9DINO
MKIAIVGAGIGGCSTARFCREEFPEADIHVFERSDQLGGRARLFNDAGESYEAGASIIHDKNQYMSDFATEFQLDKLKPALTRLTLHDGKKAVFEGSSHKPLALAQLLWRYGLGPLRLNHWVEGFLRSFQEIYQLQKASESFTLPSRLLAALDPAFASMLSTRLRDAMLEKGFSGKMLEELVQGDLVTKEFSETAKWGDP